jgi:hypothetical protein
MLDVSLYGHLTLDRVFSRKDSYCSVGSLGNVWKHLNKINPALNIGLNPTELGEALIYVDVDKCERASVANLSNFVSEPEIHPSRWSHILYLNELTDVSFVPKISEGIVSADLCAGASLQDLSVLSHLDFLFISDEDLFMDLLELGKLVKGSVILHHSGGSKWTDGKTVKTHTITKLANVNVLGCGDMFASLFINNYLSGEADISSIIKQCHDGITSILKNQL